MTTSEGEPRLEAPALTDVRRADYLPVLEQAAKNALEHNMPMIASALAYSAFFAMPSVLLVATGLFTLVAGPDTITSLLHHLDRVMPAEATKLLGSSLRRLDQQHAAGVAMTVVGFVLAIWSATGAMNACMTGLNMAYGRKDSRSFLKKRLVALAMVAAISFAFLLVAVLLIFGPPIERYLGRALGLESVLGWVWWAAQWPILIAGLLAAFAIVLRLGPDLERRRWRLVTPGTVLAAVVWLAASAGFAVYTSMFGSYNKTWGSLAAVIVMLTWLWLTGLALLFGADVDAEAARVRERRQRT